MSFTDKFIQRPVLATSISLLIALLGLQAISKMQVREYPEVTNTVITVTTGYYGASADLVQGFITTPLEQSIAQANNIEYMTSQSRQGLSVISVNMKLNTDADAALADVLAKVNAVRSKLPKEVEDPQIDRSSGQATSMLYLGFNSDTITSSQITDYLERVIQPQLFTVNGIAKINLYGGEKYAMRIWLDPEKMGAFSLNADDLAAILLANNSQSATGQMVGEFVRYNNDTVTQVSSVAELEKLVVASQNGRIIYLGDIANITLEKSHDRVRVLANGRESVVMAIDVVPNVNPIVVAKDVLDLLPTIRRNLLQSIDMSILYDTTIAINAAIKQVIKTLIEASVIVILVMILFMGSLRAVIIPMITIPLSLLGAILLMQACGFSINQMTLLAMVLAIGLVVDDAIVVVENVDRHLKGGKSPFRAAVIGTREIVLPVISMTITLIAVYAPVALMGGLTGSLLQEFALTLAGAVLVSGVIALVLSPMMCAKLLRGEESNFEKAVGQKLARLADSYEALLKMVIQHRPVFLVFSLLVLGSLPLLFSFIKGELAPVEDRGVMVMMGSAPAMANLDFIQQTMGKVDTILGQQPEIEYSQIISGVPGSNQAFGVGTLKPWSQRKASPQELIKRITPSLQKIPAMTVTAFSLPELPGVPLGLPVQFVITTAKPFEQLYAIASDFLAAAKGNHQFIFSNLDLNYDSATLKMIIDRERAGAYGITMKEISNTLATMAADGYINRIDLQGQAYEVVIQTERKRRMGPEALASYYVRAADGRPVPLNHLISTKMMGMPLVLPHLNQLNSATVSIVPAPGVAIGDAVDWCKGQAEQTLPAGYSYDFLGEARQFIAEGHRLFAVFAVAVAVIFLVLAMQFESMRDPLVILVSVPLAASGALISMFWSGTTFNIYSQIGLVTLVGLISKHGILICEVAKVAQLEQGMDLIQSVTMAAKLRLRPILMTTAAMIAGLLPLLFSSGAGAAARFNIGLVLVAGLGIGTIFTLLVLPVIYTVIASRHQPLEKFEED